MTLTHVRKSYSVLMSLDGISGSLIQTSLSGVSDQRRRLKFRLIIHLICPYGELSVSMKSRKYMIGYNSLYVSFHMLIKSPISSRHKVRAVKSLAMCVGSVVVC